MGYPLSIVKVIQGGGEREREQQIINKIEIDRYLFVEWNEQIKSLVALDKKCDEKIMTKMYQLR